MSRNKDLPLRASAPEMGDDVADPDDLARSHPMDDVRDGNVPSWLATSASIAWRLLVIAGALFATGFVLSQFLVIVVPLLVAALIAAAISPPVRWMTRRDVPPILATWIMIIVAGVLIAVVGWLLAPRLADGFSDVGASVSDAYGDVREWFVDTVGLDPADVDETESRIVERLRSLISSGIASGAALLVQVITAFFLTLVIAFFYIKDGPGIREGIVVMFPRSDRDRARETMQRGWWVLQRYLVGVVVVGAVDALLIGIGLMIIGVPNVLPVMALTFFGAFLPIVGGLFAGAVATLLALASGGIGDALLVVALTVAVQQIDGDVIGPLVYSRAINLHPVAILIALTAGSIIGGIIGALLAVPILAVSLEVTRAWNRFGEGGSSPEDDATAQPA